MLKKYGKFYADWDDARGRRRRKAFTTKKAALRFQTKQRNESAAKKAQGKGPRAKSSKPSPKRHRANTTRRTSPANSPRSSAKSAPTN